MGLIKYNRNYEKYAESAPESADRPVNMPEIKIAAIINTSTFSSLKAECCLLALDENNYIDIIQNNKVELLLADQDGINDYLPETLELCIKFNIRRVFWDTGEAKLFYRHNELLRHFDYIFTIDPERIDDYKKVAGHENVYFLPLGVQPMIYNPVEKYIMNKEELIAKGSSIELNRVMGSPFKIYDILCKKPAPEEVFQLQASGVPLISPYSHALEELFPQAVKLYRSEGEKVEIFSKLLKDKDNIDKISVLGQRCILNSHTYTHRLDTILLKTGLKEASAKLPGVTMVTCTNRPDSMENVFKNYECQTYQNKELIVVLNNNKMDLEEWRDKAQKYEKVQIFQLDEKNPLGRCLNLAIDNSAFPYFSKCDDDNYYGPDFLADLMNTFKYANTEIVGKLTYYCYLEGSHILAIMCPNMEYRYVNMLSGSALIIKKEVFDKIRFSDKRAGSDTVFLRECINNGVRMFSSDRFNYVYKRHPSQANHTWKMDDEVFLRSCKFVDVVDDFIDRVTV